MKSIYLGRDKIMHSIKRCTSSDEESLDLLESITVKSLSSERNCGLTYAGLEQRQRRCSLCLILTCKTCRSIRISGSSNDRSDHANNDVSNFKKSCSLSHLVLLELFEQTFNEMLPSRVQGQKYALNECRDDFTPA